MPDSTVEFWGAAQVYGGQESRAVENLVRQGFEAFYPQILELSPGRKLEAARPAFPGYVFIGVASDMTWGPINNTFGVIRLLTRRLGDIWVPDRVPLVVIESLMAHLVTDDRGRVVIPPGTTVHIKAGPFADRDAIVQWSVGDRLGLFFSLFNRDMEVEFALSDVEIA